MIELRWSTKVLPSDHPVFPGSARGALQYRFKVPVLVTPYINENAVLEGEWTEWADVQVRNP